MKDTLILKDNTVIVLEAGANLGALQVLAANKAAMLATWDKLTEANLAAVQVKNGDSLVVGNYKNLVLVSETSTVAPDQSVLTTYSLREKTSVEMRIDAVEAGQEVQDGAIAEVAGIVGGVK
ncbi:MAG: hypothetical protein RSD33_10195 [Clostridium sp.]